MKLLLKFKLFCGLILICLLVSCEYFHGSNGTVIDSETKKPLDSVLVESFFVNKTKTIFCESKYTDSTGIFDMGTGPLGKEEANMDFIILFSKTGYKNLIVNEPCAHEIALEKNIYKRYHETTLYKR